MDNITTAPAPFSAPSAPALGTHLVIEMRTAAPALLSNVAHLTETMRAAANAAGAMVLSSEWKTIGEGQSVTGVLVLAEGHMVIHTFANDGYASIDVMALGRCDPWKALAILKSGLRAVLTNVTTVARAMPAYGIELEASAP